MSWNTNICLGTQLYALEHKYMSWNINLILGRHGHRKNNSEIRDFFTWQEFITRGKFISFNSFHFIFITSTFTLLHYHYII